MILENIFSQSSLFIVTLFLIMFTVIIFFLMLILRNSQNQNRELISTMRDSYEKQLYMMNERLTASSDRWRDVNHLLVSSQKSQPFIDQKNKIYFSSFLKANGLTPADIELDKEIVFVLTPFNNIFNEVYRTIQSTCMDIGLKCYRGDEQFLQGDILPHILKLICKSSIVIANIEGRNPNVFYELGIAHALNKNTLLVTKTIENLPIDIKAKRIIIYRNLKDLRAMLKDELLKLAYTDRDLIEPGHEQDLLDLPLTPDTLEKYTNIKYPWLSVSLSLQKILLNDIIISDYPTLRQIDDAINRAMPAVEAYHEESPRLFESGTDYITKSLGFVDSNFRAAHRFSPETIAAFDKYGNLVKGS